MLKIKLLPVVNLLSKFLNKCIKKLLNLQKYLTFYSLNPSTMSSKQNLITVLNRLTDLANTSISDNENQRSGVYGETLKPVLTQLTSRIAELDVSAEDLDQTVDFERKQDLENTIEDFFTRYVSAIYNGYKLGDLPEGFKRSKNKRTEFFASAFAELDKLPAATKTKINESPFEGITITEAKKAYAEWQKILAVQIEKKVNVEKIAELIDMKYLLTGVLRMLNLTQLQINFEMMKES
jgi:hypothetical protein